MKTVLVIAESFQDQQECLQALSCSGKYMIVTAVTAEMGLSYLSEHRVDVVVMNFQQSKVYGLDLVQAIRSRAKYQPFTIMLVKEEQMVEAARALNVGADEFLLKDGEKRYLQYLPKVIESALADFRVNSEFHQLRRLHHTILDTVSEGIVRIDEQGRIVAANQSAARMVGMAVHDWIGRPVGDFFPDLAQESRFDRSLLYRSITRGKRFHQPAVTLVTQAGHDLPIKYTASPYYDENGGVLGAVLVFQDISTSEELERSKAVLVSNLSGLLGRPLTALRDTLGELASGSHGVLDDAYKALVDRAGNHCEQLVQQMEALLGLSPAGAGGLESEKSPLDLCDVVRDCIRSNGSYFDRFAVEVNVDTQLAQAPVQGDRDRLMQVLTNLLTNAAKFSPEKGRITVGIEQAANKVRVYVADQGPGIPERLRQALLGSGEGYDAAELEDREGAALGLSVCKAIIDRHNGEIAIEDSYPQGAKVSFALDLAH